MFYNAKNHSGWIVSVLKNRRLVAKRTKDLQGTEDDGESSDVEQCIAYTEENAKEDCTFLRTAVVNSANRAEIEEKLKATADYRKKISSDPANSLLKNFPLFFTHSEMVKGLILCRTLTYVIIICENCMTV